MENESSNFSASAVKALVELHDKHFLSFYGTWKQCKIKNIILPKTDDPDYNSLDALLRHALKSSKNYLIWICKNSDLDSPNISSIMVNNFDELNISLFINQLLLSWKHSLVDLKISDLEKVFLSNWNVEFSIEAMLEHAVMHCIRHEYQLINLLKLPNN